jgi:hypothetical protein
MRPLKRETALPSWVRGPVDFFALLRLAASCRGETVFLRFSWGAPGPRPWPLFFDSDMGISKSFPLSG